jgi:hypothetical protein
LLDAGLFQIIPSSSYHAQNPRDLPREVYVNEALGVLAGNISGPASSQAKQKKKLGRPSNREKSRRARENVEALNRWLEGTANNPSGSTPLNAGPFTPDDLLHPAGATSVPIRPPTGTANRYREVKVALLDAILPEGEEDHEGLTGRDAVMTANQRVLERLRRIDALAAEKGLEVGGAGGTRTGLARVERAMEELRMSARAGSRAGVLSLSEGAGLSTSEDGVVW